MNPNMIVRKFDITQRYFFFMPLIFALLLIGCASSEESDGTAINSQLENFSLTPTTFIATTSGAGIEVQPTPTAASHPTATSIPIPAASATSTATPTITPTPTVTPTPIGGPGVLMFAQGLDIFTMNSDGSNRQLRIPSPNITSAIPLPENTQNNYMILSPDGTKAVIASEVSPARPIRLFVFDLLFDNIYEFDAGEFRAYRPLWSPTGNRLLVIGSNPRTSFYDSLFIIETANESFGETISLGQYRNNYAPVWSADGEHLILFQEGAVSQIEPNGIKQQLSCSFCDALWGAKPSAATLSGDGSKLAVLYEYEQKLGAETTKLVVANSDLSDAQTYSLGVYAQSVLFWSYDNMKLAFLRYRIGGTEANTWIGAGGTGIFFLDGDRVETPVIATQNRSGIAVPCGWSADSSLIYVLASLSGLGQSIMSYNFIEESEATLIEWTNSDLTCPLWFPEIPPAIED